MKSLPCSFFIVCHLHLFFQWFMQLLLFDFLFELQLRDSKTNYLEKGWSGSFYIYFSPDNESLRCARVVTTILCVHAPPCHDPDCGGHGSCDQGVCRCHGNWKGENCDRLECPGDCSEHGSCLEGVVPLVVYWDIENKLQWTNFHDVGAPKFKSTVKI